MFEFVGLSVADAGTDALTRPEFAMLCVSCVTYSTDFPTRSAFQTSLNGLFTPPGQNPNAFVAKFDYSMSGSNSLVYSTYLGGSGDSSLFDMGFGNGDFGFGIAADASGNAYIVGQTYSADFPGTSSCSMFGQTNMQSSSDVGAGGLKGTGRQRERAGLPLFTSVAPMGRWSRASRSSPLHCGNMPSPTCNAYGGIDQHRYNPRLSGRGFLLPDILPRRGLPGSRWTFVVLTDNTVAPPLLEYTSLFGGSGNQHQTDTGPPRSRWTSSEMDLSTAQRSQAIFR